MLAYTRARELTLALVLTVCDDSQTHKSCKHEFINQKENTVRHKVSQGSTLSID